MNDVLTSGTGVPDEAVDLFPHYEQEGGPSPEAVAGAADDIEMPVLTIRALATDFEAAHRPAAAAMHGDLQAPAADAPTATNERLGGVEATSLLASGSTRLFGTDGVHAYDDLVDGLRSEYAERKLEITASDCDVAEVDYPDGATERERAELDEERDAEILAARDEQIAELVRELQGRQEEYRSDPLDAEAELAAKRLKEGPTKEVMQDLYAAGGLPTSAVDVLPGYNLDEVPLDEWPPDLKGATDEEKAEWLLDHPEQGAILVGEASDDVIEIMGEELADQARDLDSKSSAEDIEALDEALNAWGLEVNAQFVKALGGDELVELVTTLGENYDGNRDNRDAALALAESLQSSAQDASWTLDEDEARQVADDMVDAVEHSDGKSHTMALSFLLHNGRYGTEFLDTVGDRLDAYERSDEFESWLEMSTPNTGVYHLFVEGAREAAFDPMASYMSALGGNGEAALEFFDEGDDREKYYFKERYWGHDDFDSVLSALDAATTDTGNLEDPETAEKAAGLVSSAVEYLVNRSDNFGGWDGDGGECFEPGDVGDVGTEALAHMISTYMPAVDYYTSPNGLQGPGDYADETAPITVPGLGRLNDMPVFEKTDLAKLVQVAVSTEDGFTQMREGVSAYQNLSLQEAVANGRDIQDVANSDGRLEGFFLKQVGDVEIEEAASQDAQAQAWIDLGKSLTGAIPTPAGKGTGAILSALIGSGSTLGGSEVSEALTDNVEGVLEDLREGKVPSSFAERRLGMAATLYDADAITMDDIEKVAASVDEDTGEPWATPEQVDEWFAYGFPSQETINENQDLENLLSAVLGNEGVDLNEYWLTYKSEMTNEFAQ